MVTYHKIKPDVQKQQEATNLGSRGGAVNTPVKSKVPKLYTIWVMLLR